MSIVFNFPPMYIFPIPFFTFVSSDGTHSGFTIRFFKIEYVFIMRSDWFYPVSQVLSCVLNHRAVNSPQGHVSSTCFPFFYLVQTLSVLFFFSQSDIN